MVRTVRAFGDRQPVAELGVEVGRGRERAAGHEGGLEELVASLHDALRLWIAWPQPMQTGGQRAREGSDPLSVTFAAADAGLVVPDQPSWHPTQLLQELPGRGQQVLGAPRGDHPAHNETRVSRCDHQHRQQHFGAVLEWDLPGREPQVALRGVPGRPRQPVRRVDRPVLGTQPPDVVAEPRDRPGPADPLREHRGRHVRVLLQQLPDPREYDNPIWPHCDALIWPHPAR